jgi:transcriptional regulator with XRE-family HTH domain
MAERAPNPVDFMVGQNIRFQRLKKGLSQEALADRLGLTFQQVQKYEKGANRTSASRLVHMASIFGVSVITFFDGVDQVKGTADVTLGKILKEPKTMQLLQAFAAIRNKDVKAAIVEFVTQISSS